MIRPIKKNSVVIFTDLDGTLLNRDTFKFDEIEEFKAVSYSPLKDYRGWGIKHGFSGTAYNVKGSKGVRIHLKNKSRHILFGSQKNEAFEVALKKFIKP